MLPISAGILLKTNFHDLHTLWGNFTLLLLAFHMSLEPKTDNFYGKWIQMLLISMFVTNALVPINQEHQDCTVHIQTHNRSIC
jgi:hypothetical protein